MASFDASEIVNWSGLPDAPHRLPELVRRLVWATAKVSDIYMPSGSSVRLGGWDGLVTATDGRPWVPEGHSAWELSCDKHPRAKATSDYDKRTGDPLSVEVAKLWVDCDESTSQAIRDTLEKYAEAPPLTTH